MKIIRVDGTMTVKRVSQLVLCPITLDLDVLKKWRLQCRKVEIHISIVFEFSNLVTHHRLVNIVEHVSNVVGKYVLSNGTHKDACYPKVLKGTFLFRCHTRLTDATYLVRFTTPLRSRRGVSRLYPVSTLGHRPKPSFSVRERVQFVNDKIGVNHE